ncbi:hypothetical protein T552_03208 [Pneumocystis carinii B80]|uniref:SHSP domain-containing protein n=1 Tax=Pneumocystis carinii (strain B80) TaxID=1408658 RepID=A0A0W4ZCA4_PNEC8|nr:hypothetical protein T552_03208 [Pneumocystis carinii B80]KTW25934.1 hypothetical protein T552_03208 [Pneumocystis carinii B80]
MLFPRVLETSFFPTDLGRLIHSTFDEPLIYFKENLSDRTLSPRIDMSESANGYQIEAELPGLGKDNIIIEFIDEKTIVIQGHIERNSSSKLNGNGPTVEEISDEESKSKSKTKSLKVCEKNVSKNPPHVTYWYKERAMGEFSRKIHFPTSVDRDHVKASLENGILKINVPKSACSVSRRIAID